MAVSTNPLPRQPSNIRGVLSALQDIPVAGQEGEFNRYEEVYNRPSSGSDPNRGVYAWGDDTNRTYQLAYNSFRSLFGRNPTQGEFNQIMGAFQGPNSAITGRAYLSQLQQQYQANPFLDPSNPRYSGNQNPNEISNNVAQQFKTILGRDATKEELEHFTEAIRSNQTDAYGLSSFLKMQPEYTNAQDKQFRGGLNAELEGYDQQAFGRMKNDVYADYNARGLGQSSALDYAMTDLMGKIAENRGKFLSQLSANQYGGNKELATNNYRGVLDDFATQNAERRRASMGYGNELLNRGFEGADYGIQMRDYNNMMNSREKRNRTLHGEDWLNFGLSAANAGMNAFGYLGGQGGGGGGGGFSPYSGGTMGPYAYGGY